MAADSKDATTPEDVAPEQEAAPEDAQRYVVKVEATVVHVNTVNERYLYRGAVVPETVVAAEIQRLLDLGFVEAV